MRIIGKNKYEFTNFAFSFSICPIFSVFLIADIIGNINNNEKYRCNYLSLCVCSIEILRRINYGHSATTGLQRVHECLLTDRNIKYLFPLPVAQRFIWILTIPFFKLSEFNLFINMKNRP